MNVIRRHLTAIGCVWLLFQTAMLALPSYVSCCAGASQAAVAEDDDVCCEGMAPGQICPLHKHRQAPKHGAHHDQPTGRCEMRSGCSPVDPALVSLGFGLGILPPPVSLDVIPVSILVQTGPAAVVHRARSLDPPPPRA